MNRKLEKGDSINFDFGVTYNGYCTDFGRTAFLGEPTREFLGMYHLVIKAEEVAIKAMVDGTITGSQLDSVARDVIGKAGSSSRTL